MQYVFGPPTVIGNVCERKLIKQDILKEKKDSKEAKKIAHEQALTNLLKKNPVECQAIFDNLCTDSKESIRTLLPEEKITKELLCVLLKFNSYTNLNLQNINWFKKKMQAFYNAKWIQCMAENCPGFSEIDCKMHDATRLRSNPFANTATVNFPLIKRAETLVKSLGYHSLMDDQSCFTKEELEAKYATDFFKNSIKDLENAPANSTNCPPIATKNPVKYWLGCIGYYLFASGRVRTKQNDKPDNRVYKYYLKLKPKIELLLPDFIGNQTCEVLVPPVITCNGLL